MSSRTFPISSQGLAREPKANNPLLSVEGVADFAKDVRSSDGVLAQNQFQYRQRAKRFYERGGVVHAQRDISGRDPAQQSTLLENVASAVGDTLVR